MSDPGLFAEPEHIIPTPHRLIPLGVGPKRSARILALIAANWHPATRMPLHPQAAPARTGAGLRCRGCVFAVLKPVPAHGYYSRSYFKCRKRSGFPVGPDLRLWWPACSLFKEK